MPNKCIGIKVEFCGFIQQVNYIYAYIHLISYPNDFAKVEFVETLFIGIALS